MEIDAIDKKILNTIVHNSRLSFREIAKKVGVSVVTVLKRVKNLEKNKILLGYSSLLNYDVLGYDMPVMVRVSIDKDKLFEVQRKIASHPNVSATYDITGDFDALVLAKFKNRRSLDTFIKKIQGLPYVQRTETNLILNTLKETNIEVD